MSDNEEYYDQYDDEGAAEYLSDADQSPLSSPPNSPLRLSPCSDDNDDEDHRGDNLGGAPAKLDLSALQLPAIAAAENSTATNLDNPRVGPRLRLDSPDEDDGFAGLHHRHQGGGSKSGGGTTMNRRVFSSSALDSSQQQHRRFQGSHVALQSAMGSSLSALDRKAAAAAADAAALSFSSRAHVPGARLSQDRARPQQQQRHNYQPSSLRDSNGGSFVLPFEDEIDGAPFTSGSSTLALEGSGRSLVVPAAINEFPSLDEDDDNDAGAAAAAERFEIPAAPTDELPPLGSADLGRSRAVGSPDPADPYTGVPPDYDRPANGERRANNNLPPLRPAPSGTHNSDPEKDAPQIHAEASSQAPPAVANPWMSFNLLRQRVIEAVSPLPPISTIVIEPGPGDEVEDNFQVAPASPAGGDEPPSLSRSAVADSRPQMNVSLDDTSMHPLDERDELQQNAYSMRPHHGSLLQSQSADQRMKRDRAVDAEKKGLPSLAVNGAPTRTAEFVPSEVQSLSFDPPKRREVVAVVTPPHPPLHSSSEIADRKSKTPSVSIRRVAEPAPTESASPVVVSPPVTRNALAPQSSLTIAGRTNVDSRRDSFGDEVKLCDRGTHGGWWLEEELNKREQLRVGGDKKQFSVAERIAALKFKIDSPPSSQPSSPDRPVVGKRPASISAPQRPLASRLEPPGTNLPSDPTSTPDKISIVGVFSPPAMKRINDSHESFANVDRSVGSVSSSARATEAFHDAESFADATELSDCFHDAEPETSTSLIGSIESMVRDIEVSTSRKARSTTTSVNRTPLPPVSLPPKPHVAQTQKADGSVRRLADSFSSPQSQASPTDLGASPFASLSKGLDSAYLMDRDKPVLVKSLDSEIGIPKGDVMVSLLGTDSTWSSNVNEAVWRCRTMRHTCDTKWLQGKADKRPVPGHATSLAGSFEGRSQGASLENVQTTAIDHLKYDEMDDALLHYENLLRWYDDFFARECEQAAKSSRQSDITSAKLVVGQAMHNIGVIKLLKGDHGAALTFFERACLNRASCGRLGHPDHTVSTS